MKRSTTLTILGSLAEYHWNTTKEISKATGFSPRTVRRYLLRLYENMQVRLHVSFKNGETHYWKLP